MEFDISKIPILARREIEARIAGPLINAYIEVLGRDKGLEVASKVITQLARQSGADLAKAQGGNTIAHLVKGQGQWSAGGAIKREVLDITETTYNYNVVRCQYAEMYRRLGLADLGSVLSCARDRAMFEGFNPKLKLTRTQTIMEGADYCDFRLTLE